MSQQFIVMLLLYGCCLLCPHCLALGEDHRAVPEAMEDAGFLLPTEGAGLRMLIVQSCHPALGPSSPGTDVSHYLTICWPEGLESCTKDMVIQVRSVSSVLSSGVHGPISCLLPHLLANLPDQLPREVKKWVGNLMVLLDG